MKRLLNITLVAAALTIPLLGLAPQARADALQEVATQGLPSKAIVVTGAPDGKFAATDIQVSGTWRIDGDKPSTPSNLGPNQSYLSYPKDKSSGDRFEVTSEPGAATIWIK